MATTSVTSRGREISDDPRDGHAGGGRANRPWSRWFLVLLVLCLAAAGTSCTDTNGSSDQEQIAEDGGPEEEAGGGGPEEEAGNPREEDGGPPSADGDGGVGGPEEQPADPAGTPEEVSACSVIPYADANAVAAYQEFAERPEGERTQQARDEIANLFDAAHSQVDSHLQGLPSGPVLRAGEQVLAEQAAVRDALTEGGSASLDELFDARDALERACAAE